MSNEDCISWGKKVVLKRNDNYKIIEIYEGRKENFENCSFQFQGAIGYPFGTEFSIEQHQLVPISKENNVSHILASKSDETFESNKDNRDLVDCKQNQSLSTDSIKQMKKEGATGLDILNKLVENSSSFSSKTKFSQEKYLLKKKKRHLPIISVLKPSTRILCDVYSGKKRPKVLGLRIDTLSQILSYANVHYGSNVLLSETCAGLVLGAILERQGYFLDSVDSPGHVVHFFHGTAPLRPDFFSTGNVDHKRWWSSRVTEIPMRDLTSLRLLGQFSERVQMPIKENPKTNQVSEQPEEIDKEGCDNNTEPNSKRQKLDDNSQTENDRRTSKLLREEASKSALFGRKWDSLIVAVKFHPQDLVVGMLHFLSPGRPLVVYCQFMQPLVELLNCLKKRGGVELLQIHETWFRHYQILPERTHPTITMSGTGGFLLTGITTHSDYLTDPTLDFQHRNISAAR